MLSNQPLLGNDHIRFDLTSMILYLQSNTLLFKLTAKRDMSRGMRFPTMWYVRPTKPQISLRKRAVWSEPLLVAWVFLIVKLLTEHSLEFLSLKRGCRGSPESTLVKMSNWWKSHALAQLLFLHQLTYGIRWKSIITQVNQQFNIYKLEQIKIIKETRPSLTIKTKKDTVWTTKRGSKTKTKIWVFFSSEQCGLLSQLKTRNWLLSNSD